MIEQHDLKVLAQSGETMAVSVVLSPASVSGGQYALEVICAAGNKRYLMRQKIKRIRNFKTIDAAWAIAKKLGVKEVSLLDRDLTDDGNK